MWYLIPPYKTYACDCVCVCVCVCVRVCVFKFNTSRLIAVKKQMKSTTHFVEGKRGVRGFVYYRLFRWEWVNLCHSINHTCACACVCVRVFDQIQVDVQKAKKVATGRGNILFVSVLLLE